MRIAHAMQEKDESRRECKIFNYFSHVMKYTAQRIMYKTRNPEMSVAQIYESVHLDTLIDVRD
jgi:hypothetical protein